MFDIGFSLTHFLSKTNHNEGLREDFLKLARCYWQAYRDQISPSFWDQLSEPRAVSHTLACLLARVHGRSPLEYLSETSRNQQTTSCLTLMNNPPNTIPELIAEFNQRL